MPGEAPLLPPPPPPPPPPETSGRRSAKCGRTLRDHALFVIKTEVPSHSPRYERTAERGYLGREVMLVMMNGQGKVEQKQMVASKAEQPPWLQSSGAGGWVVLGFGFWMHRDRESRQKCTVDGIDLAASFFSSTHAHRLQATPQPTTRTTTPQVV